MRLWERIGFSPMEEPSPLVDALLEQHPSLRDAADRQAAIYRKYVQGGESAIA
jgi:hypothetical protein